MKSNFMKFRKMLSTTVFGYLITSTLTMLGANKLPDIIVDQIQSLKGLHVSFQRFNLFEDMGLMQRDPMGYLIIQFLLALVVIVLLVFLAYFNKDVSTDKSLTEVSKKKKSIRVVDIIVIIVIIMVTGIYGWNYTVLNTRYEMSTKLERLIELVAPIVDYNDYLWLRSNFYGIQTEDDYASLTITLKEIVKDAKKAGTIRYGDGVITMKNFSSPNRP